MRPGVGLKQTHPQNAAGVLTDPPKSVPKDTGDKPKATAAADPPLDPPEDKVLSQGFKVGPKILFSQIAPKANSGVLVFPKTIPPFFLILSTDIESFLGIKFL